MCNEPSLYMAVAAGVCRGPPMRTPIAVVYVDCQINSLVFLIVTLGTAVHNFYLGQNI